MGLRRSLEKISYNGLICEEPDSRILQVDHYGIEVLQRVLTRPALFRLRAIEANDWKLSRRINIIAHLRRVLNSEQPVLRRKKRLQLDLGKAMLQNVDRPAAFAIK